MRPEKSESVRPEKSFFLIFFFNGDQAKNLKLARVIQTLRSPRDRLERHPPFVRRSG
jgi:hypothetical protein